MIRRVNVAWFQSKLLGATRKMCHGPMRTHAYPCHHAFLFQTGNQQGVAGIWAVLRLERYARRVQRQDDQHMVILNERCQKTFEVIISKMFWRQLKTTMFFANHLVSCYFIWNPSFSTQGFCQTRSFYIVVGILYILGIDTVQGHRRQPWPFS